MARLPGAPRTERRSASVSLVTDRGHYDGVVVGALSNARVSVWIATANLKDLHVEAPIGTVARARGRFVSITDRFEDLVKRGVEIRVLHATAPSRPFRESLARRKELLPPRFEMRACPRVHMKMSAVDGAYLYLGSANFTGAGLGARGEAGHSDGRGDDPNWRCAHLSYFRTRLGFAPPHRAVTPVYEPLQRTRTSGRQD